MNWSRLQLESQNRIVRSLGLQQIEARIEVRALLRRILNVSNAWLIAHANETVDPEKVSEFEILLERRLKGEPVAYILGCREFYGMEFRVSEDVLIPRPETELLVDLAIERLPEKGRALDLGTGSGIIAVSVARIRKDSFVTAVDRSGKALEIAKLNGRELENIRFVESDWFDELEGEKYDLILSNPPYIAEGDRHLEDLKCEPLLALTAGCDGLDAIRKIVEGAPAHLEPGGWLFFEHGCDQGKVCREMLARSFGDVNSWKDLSGMERVSGGRLTSG